MSMMGGRDQSMDGMPVNYAPMMGQDAYDPHLAAGGPSMIQSQYPAGPAMSTFGGNAPFGGAPPAHGGMAGMEPSGFTQHPGETHGGHGGGGGHDSHGGGHEGGHAEIDKGTGMAPRRCTDVQTCFCFIVYAILAFTLVGVASTHGNRGRLTHGTDYYGRVCGVDQGVENMPFLFWCRSDAPSTGSPGGLNLEAPSCVPFCPTTNNPAVKISCLRPAVNTSSIIAGGQFGNVETQLVHVEESLIQTVPYPTKPRAGRYCVPTDKNLEMLVLNDNGHGLGPYSNNRILSVIGTLSHLYWLMGCATLFALGMGYLFVWCIKQCPFGLAKVFFVPLGILSLLFAVGYTLAIVLLIQPDCGFKTFYHKSNPLYARYDPTSAGRISLGVALVLWTITGAIFAMVMNFKSLGVTDLINSAFETFKAVPSLYYVPFVEGVAKFLVFWLGLQGLSAIASEGWLEKNRIHVNGAKFAGLSRHVTVATEDIRSYLMAAVWMFFFFWMMEFCTALGQFITSYCVFKYYGMKKEKGKKCKVPGDTVMQGLKNALIYHPGSILRGAILIPMYRPHRILYWMTAEIDPDAAGEPTTFGGKVTRCLTNTCMCNCLPCGLGKMCNGLKMCTKEAIEELECPCKDGFDDVVIRANDFDKATEKAHELLEHSHKIVQFLYRDHSQTTINLIGVGAITGFTSAAVYIVVSNLDMYCDPMSTLYIADPILVTVLTAILSGYIAFGFMTLWDHTADTLLYCYAWSRRWNRKTVDQYVPESLRYIVGHDDLDNDRYPYYGKAKNNMYLRYWLPMVGLEDPKKAKKAEPRKPVSAMETHSIAGLGMGRRAPDAQGSFLGGFGTNFGFGSQAPQGSRMQMGGEAAPLLP